MRQALSYRQQIDQSKNINLPRKSGFFSFIGKSLNVPIVQNKSKNSLKTGNKLKF